jgi:cytochrome P450
MSHQEPRYDVDFNDPDLIRDPFAVYEEIRARGRAVWNETLRGWMITGYDDVVAAHADPVRLSSAGQQQPFFAAPTMITSDPPEHTRLRGVAKEAFSKRSVSSMHESVTRVVDECMAADVVVDALRTGTSFDFAKEISALVPTLVIADILGVSRADRADFRQWSMELTQAVDYGRSPTAEQRRQQGMDAGAKFTAYFDEEIAARRVHPRDDLMSDLVMANANEQLSDDELTATCILLLSAGNDTTNKLISAMFMLLGRHPDERRRVLENPLLVDSAVEEALRMMGVSQATPRNVRGDIEVAGRAFGDGDVVWLMKAAANHDPSQFPDPHRFDAARSPNQHLTFGWGIHLCLGIHLARMELQVALRRLLPQLREYEVVDMRYEPTFHVRGLESLVLEPAPTRALVGT